MVGSCPQDDHRTTAGLLGILRELASDPDGLLGRHAGDLLLPGRGVGRRVVVAGRPLPGQAVAAHAVLGEHEVEHRGHQPLTAGRVDGHDRDAAGVHAAALGVLLPDVEARQQNLDVVRAPCVVQ